MPNYLLYSGDVETIAPDEAETFQKIVEMMTHGMHLSREKYGRSVRISHAKAHALLKGTLTVESGLPRELAQGLFALPGTYDAIVRMAQAPGELLDDSKVSTDRGMAVKVLNVSGEKLPGHHAETQDFVFASGPEFIAPNAKAFLSAFKPNADLAPKLSDTTKGIVSGIARVTNEGLDAIGMKSAKLGFYGHPKNLPAAQPYYSQTAFRHGDYVAKLGFFPDTPGLEALVNQSLDLETPDALREQMVKFFQEHSAEYSLRVQLNAGLDEMPVEDATAHWSEDLSQYVEVARLTIPVQTAWDPAKDKYFEDLSFDPAHSLAAHRPLGSINRSRMVVYGALSARRHQDDGTTAHEPASAQEVPA